MTSNDFLDQNEFNYITRRYNMNMYAKNWVPCCILKFSWGSHEYVCKKFIPGMFLKFDRLFSLFLPPVTSTDPFC